jgi:RNase P/RNase MRP subunit p30
VITRRAAAYGAAFTVSSGARTRRELWSPASARALLESFGLPGSVSLLALTAYCRQALRKAGLA